MSLAVAFANALLLVILIGLFLQSEPILAQKSFFHLLLSSSWHPGRGEFGFYPFITGTLGVTALAMVLALPVCLLSAIYLNEYAGRRLRETARVVIDLMAAIPSVIYGLWGVLVVVPFVRFLGEVFDHPTTGYSLLAGGIILAIMVSPVMISVSMEVLRAVPLQARETALALGTTRWEAIKKVVLRSGLHGILSAIVLGFTRAFGFVVMVYFGLTASLLAGVLTLSLLMLPIMTRSIEEIVRMMPQELKETSYALGATRIETTLAITYRQALPGIVTGVLLAFGRGIGDTASILFTAGYTDYLPRSALDPVASLPLVENRCPISVFHT